ncbi:MAG: ATP-binding protein [Chloroflexia bacterium]
MKSKRTAITTHMPASVRTWVPGRVARLLVRDGAPSIDGLDVAIRGFGVAIVVLWSLLGYGRSSGPYAWDMADPVLVSLGLILYNLVVITVIGVPWRTSPGFALFVVDWIVASGAILLTGGFLSPFILLYYALIIGAALRVGLSRSLLLAVGCSAVFVTLSLLHPEPVEAVRVPILIVQVASLLMVMLMSAGMRRAVEVEVHKVELEERAARQLRLLNNLTNTVLAGRPNLGEILRTVASASREALKADAGLAVLLHPDSLAGDAATGDSADFAIVADREPNPPMLSEREHSIIDRVTATRAPVIVTAKEGEPTLYAGLERGGAHAEVVACVPFLLDERVIGALFVARYVPQPFTQADVGLLLAISQQMAVAARMARLYEMEREKAARSEERERLERDLLSMVSHELRTPLTSIKTSVGALSGGYETRTGGGGRAEAETRLLNNIGRSTDRLINLVNELLDMARLRAGRVTLNYQELNVGEALLDTISGLRPLFEERSQVIKADLPAADSPRWHLLAVQADRRRLEQVLVNLLSNANKYSPTASIIVVGATPRNGQVRVFVRDEGPGISPQEQRRVFDKFYRAAEANHEGTGLGLAIARSIVELHGGQISVSSKPGAGSTFYFTLPQVCGEDNYEDPGD